MGKRLNKKKKRRERDRIFNYTITGKLNGEFDEPNKKCEVINWIFYTCFRASVRKSVMRVQ